MSDAEALKGLMAYFASQAENYPEWSLTQSTGYHRSPLSEGTKEGSIRRIWGLLKIEALKNTKDGQERVALELPSDLNSSEAVFLINNYKKIGREEGWAGSLALKRSQYKRGAALSESTASFKIEPPPPAQTCWELCTEASYKKQLYSITYSLEESSARPPE